MNIELEISRFKAEHGKGRIVDFSRDKTEPRRFANLHTARAWTAWIAKAKKNNL
jgi:hypothetical protein